MLKKIYNKVTHEWDTSVEEALKSFIRLPALSPDFDKKWEENGVLLKALEDAQAWAEKQGIKGLRCEIIKDDGFTPCLFVEVDATSDKKFERSVFFYGHLDKQPPNEGWDQDKSAWEPVIQNGRLYGRGAVDDGYAFYTSLAAVKALQTLGIPHPRCVGLFETCEESSSRHYESYLKEAEQKLGDIGLVIALDSCCGDYDRLWVTSSLRGMLGGTIEVRTLNVGVHSGEASGIVPESFMIVRRLLDRIEDSRTGEIIPRVFQTKISEEIHKQNVGVAESLGDRIFAAYPWHGKTEPLTKDACEALLNRSWRPELTVTGVDGMPSVENAGNVMRPYTTVKIGMRLPPDVDAEKASTALEEIITAEPPFNADVKYVPTVASNGWSAKAAAPWITKAFEKASESYWGNKPAYMGLGASIPLVKLFSEKWPHAQFMVSGALGPNSNAHGPNESLHIEYCKKQTASVAYLISQYEEH